MTKNETQILWEQVCALERPQTKISEITVPDIAYAQGFIDCRNAVAELLLSMEKELTNDS